MKQCLLLLPNMLFKKHDIDADIILYEHPKFFTEYQYHKLKLVYHRATMKEYYNTLKKRYNVAYHNHNEKPKLDKYDKIFMYDPIDYSIMVDMKKYCNKHGIELEILDSKLFILNTNEINEYVKITKNPFINATFYKYMRRKQNILMKNNDPIGSVWSYDKYNRDKFPSSYKESKIKFYTNKYILEATKYVDKYFDKNLGETNVYLPTNHKKAKSWLHKFLKNKLINFGQYEDAISSDVVIGNHSCISAMLNIGLLEPMEVIEMALLEAKSNKKINISSLEGFIRQILSWREYVRMMYILKHDVFTKQNFLGHTNKLSSKWYDGTTGLTPVDNVIKKALKYSYCHHIERLMIIGNVMLLAMIHPKYVYKWFITLVSIDAYEWVMEPNIYGMSQHSVGKLMMTRPYFSSSNYIFNMSNYKKNSDEEIAIKNVKYKWHEVWDALYYNFLNKHKKYLKKIYSTANLISFLEKKPNSEKKELFRVAREYMKLYL